MAATHIPKRSGGFSTLLKPLAHEGILIEDEVILYCQRKHWASLIRPAYETAAMLFTVTILVTGTTPTTSTGVLVTIATFIATFSYLRSRNWKKFQVYAAIAILALFITSAGTPATAILGICIISMRFITEFALWAFYHRRYITNRRVIASEGLFKSSISTMPLSRVTDISLKKSVLAEVLDYATLRVETAGQDQALNSIDFLNNPDEFYGILIKLSTTEVDYRKYFEV